MRLLNIKLEGGLLEGLFLDFALNNQAAKFVILAGENGTGKTTIINTIPLISDAQTGVAISEATLELNESDVQELIRINSDNNGKNGYYSYELSAEDFGDKPTLKLCKKQDQFPNTYIVEISDKKKFDYIHGARKQRGNAIQIFMNKILFKLWHNNVEPKMSPVANVSNYEIDSDTDEIVQNIIDLNNEINIPQLLVDLDNKDAVEFRNSYNINKQIDPSLANKRMDRFKSAFADFFDNELKLKEITPKHEVIFQKGGDEFNISGLSSGEKMIVQCGSSLLKDAGAKDQSGIILIDEPEQALHPKWQEKVLDFYADATSIDSKNNPQFFITTHSEHVLKNALCRNDAVVIILKINPDNHRAEATKMSPNEYLLNYPSYDEIKYRAFGILSQDYHDDLLCFVQECSGMNCKNQDSELLKDNSCPRKHWCGKNIDGSINPKLDTESLPFHIRHYIHHPELRDDISNTRFTDEDLRKSVSFMEEYIQATRKK